MLGLIGPVQAAMDRSAARLRMPLASATVPRRALVAAALISLVPGMMISERFAASPTGGRSSVLPAAAGQTGVRSEQRLWNLPTAAQGPVSAQLGAAEPAYRATASGGGFLLMSKAQRLAVRFDRSGVVVSSNAISLGITLRAVGFGSSLRAVGEVTPSAHANRVSYAHAGLEEWYENGPLGLEQGFTVSRAPAGHRAGPLTFSMALSGDARAALAPGGQSLTFSHGGGTTLRYGGLLAVDARGRIMHSWLALAGGKLLLRVDTRGARYPLRIDPLLGQGKLTGDATERTAAGALGISVALSADGNTALIGAPHDAGDVGSAWAFTRSGSTWTQQGPKLTGGEEKSTGCAAVEEEELETGAGGHFGGSVALSADGDTALIGGAGDSGCVGAAWVFTRSGTTWSQQTKLAATPSEEAGKARFGRGVALSSDGHTALIGGPRDNIGKGAVWVFTREGATWTQQGEKLTGSEEKGEGYFGRAVALSGDSNTALIGAAGDSKYTGAAWVFARSGTTWTQQGAKLTGSEEKGEGHFGRAVALSGDASTALIGGYGDSGRMGAAWMLTRSGATWAQQKLTVEGESGEVYFGYEVALSGDGGTALIGGPFDNLKAGAAWVFTRSGSAWAQGEKLTGSEPAGKSQFGYSVALSSSGTTALVGGPYDSAKAGAAWAFGPEEVPREEEENKSGLKKPKVGSVTPNEGFTTGGTTVTISGRNFTGATAVNFGSTRAPSFSVNSATSITAVAPAEAAGTVDVTVTTPIAVSPVSASDRFTFVTPTATPEGSKELPRGSSSTNNSTSTAGGVLGYGVSTTAACKVSLLSRRIAVRARSRAALKLIWQGTGICRGRVTLKVKVRTATRRSRLRTIGTGAFSLVPGQVGVVSVKLNAAGRALLRAGHGAVAASLVILTLSPGPAQATSASVRLTVQRPRKPATPKK